jgi:3',5'-cyclic AMP phosphodiesterase CpdA
MLFAQVSDPHVCDAVLDPVAGIDARARLVRVLATIGAAVPRVDGIVLSGDLVEQGTAADYRLLASILAGATAPVWLMVGNHDDRDELVRAFPHFGAFVEVGRLRYVIEGDDLRLVMLDSLVPGQPGGALGAEQLGWLDRVLAESATPAVVFVHHPPPTSGLRHVDRSALADADEFARVLRRHPQVVRVACGHLHQGLVLNWAETTLSACPSTAHGFALDLAGDGRTTPIASPAAFQMHRWHGGVLHTYTVAVD